MEGWKLGNRIHTAVAKHDLKDVLLIIKEHYNQGVSDALEKVKETIKKDFERNGTIELDGADFRRAVDRIKNELVRK